MPSVEDLVRVTEESPFIFTAAVTRAGESTVAVLPADAANVVVKVGHVIKVPAGLHDLAGRDVTVQLRHPLREGHYVFFADPLAVGQGIALKEREHLDASARGEVEASSFPIPRLHAWLSARRHRPHLPVALHPLHNVMDPKSLTRCFDQNVWVFPLTRGEAAVC